MKLILCQHGTVRPSGSHGLAATDMPLLLSMAAGLTLQTPIACPTSMEGENYDACMIWLTAASLGEGGTCTCIFSVRERGKRLQVVLPHDLGFQ